MSSEKDLTALLSVEQREELTLLVASCIESVRTVLRKAFEGSELTDDDRGLRNDALASFDEWKLSLLTRVGEVLNYRNGSTPDSLPPQSTKKPPSAKSSYGAFKVPESPLADLPTDTKTAILSAILLLSLSLSQHNYDPRSRTTLHILSTALQLPPSLLLDLEKDVAAILVSAAMKAQDAEIEKRVDASASSRRWKIGLAGVAGGILVGVTGGLAAPLVAAGLGTLFGAIGLGGTIAASYLGALASSSVLVGALFGGYGAKMSSDMMSRYSAEVNDFNFVPLHPESSSVENPSERRLSVRIGVTGWLSDTDSSPSTPWEIFDSSSDSYCLSWELEALRRLGGALKQMVLQSAIGYAKKEVIRRTFFAGLWTALAVPVGMLKFGKIVDNPWSIGMLRAKKAGEVLASALINKAQGERPVTLVGYSLGSRLLYYCLLSLAKQCAFGIVENVIFMGSPIPAGRSAEWRAIRSVVSGRVVNCFAKDDWILAFVYRSSSLEWGVAGLEKVVCVDGVENVDVGGLVTGHLQYRFVVGEVLERVGMGGLNERVVEMRVKEGEEEEIEEEKEVEELQKNETGISEKLEDIHLTQETETSV